MGGGGYAPRSHCIAGTQTRTCPQVQAQLEAAGGEPAAAAGVDTSVVASFHVIYATGWAPHGSQQQPKARGSATARFADFGAPP